MNPAAKAGLGLALCIALGAVAHWLIGDTGPLTVAAHATAGWWWIGGLLALALAAAGRDPRALAAAAASLALTLSWTAPGTLGATAPPGGPTLTVAVANVLSSNPEVDQLLAELEAESPDVVGLIELREHHGALLNPAFTPMRWHARRFSPRPDNFGIALLGGPECATPWGIGVGGVPWLVTTATVGRHKVEILVAHTLPPVSADYHAVWREQLAFLALRQADGRPRIVIADLNLTRHNPSFRTLLRAGYRDAFALAGRAANRTWTPFKRPPDLLRLDHVLVSEGIGVQSIRVLPRRGSDHRAIVATLQLER